MLGDCGVSNRGVRDAAERGVGAGGPALAPRFCMGTLGPERRRRGPAGLGGRALGWVRAWGARARGVAMRRIVLLPGLLAGALVATGCVTLQIGRGGPAPLVEQLVFGDEPSFLGAAVPKILLLDVDGMLSEQGDSGTFGIGGSESPVARVREQLERAEEAGDIRALLVRIHSPGGTATASEILYDEIRRFKQEHQVPVVAQLMGVAASGGYYVAMAADTLRAYPTTVTGSIGVIFAGLNVSGMMDKLGVVDQTLTSGPYKDAGSPLRPMTETERAQLESVIGDLYARFLEVVEAGRPELSRQQIEELADGRIYSARQALEAGLIDAVGDLPAAAEEARRRAGLERAQVVIYARPGELRENLFSLSAPDRGLPRLQVLPSPSPGVGPSFLYLWWPGDP